MTTQKNKSCPTTPIEINNGHKIVNTDEKNFPWRQDANGYFLVKIENGKLHCGFVNNNHEMIVEFVGVDSDKMIKEIAERKLCDMEHIGYIASELMIAHNCLLSGKNYIQR